jgi:hypothetical protein
MTCYRFDRNPGYLLSPLTASELGPIWQAVKDIQADYAMAQANNDYLTGNIEHQYQLPITEHVEQVLGPRVQEYVDQFGYAHKLQHLTMPRPLKIWHKDLWVNFQQQGEFNPPHHHSGIFSFVIWLQVPYLESQELAAGPGHQGYEPQSGDFVFQYVDSLGQIRPHRMHVDQGLEGYLCVFPSELTHYVNPFYSTKELRISVAGNLKYAV